MEEKNVWRVAWWIMNMISGIQYKSERHHVLRKKGEKKTTKEQKEYTSLKSVMCSGCGIKCHKRPLSGVHYLISCFPLKKFVTKIQTPASIILSKWPLDKSLVTFDVSVDPPYEQIGAQKPNSSTQYPQTKA